MGPETKVRGNTLHAELMYPPYENDADGDKVRYVQVGMCHVRATDDIRISYHFGRNGWLIEQASTFCWSLDDEVRDPGWAEVAFIPSWARHVKTEFED